MHRCEDGYSENSVLGISPESFLAPNIRQRIAWGKVGRFVGAGVLILGSACVGNSGVDGKSRQAVMGSVDDLKDNRGSLTSPAPAGENKQSNLIQDQGVVSGYCPLPEKLNDGTDRMRVCTTSTCPVQVVPLAPGWVTFDSNSFGYKLDGGADVESVSRDGNCWVIDP